MIQLYNVALLEENFTAVFDSRRTACCNYCVALHPHPRKSLPEKKFSPMLLTVAILWFFCELKKKRSLDSSNKHLRSLLYFTICSTTKFIPLKVDLELFLVFFSSF